MSLNPIPESISLAPRSGNIFSAANQHPQSRSGSAVLWLDLKCQFLTKTQADRNALESDQDYQTNWTDCYGLAGYKAQRSELLSHEFLGDALAKTSTGYELIAINPVANCGDGSVFPALPDPLVKANQLEPVDTRAKQKFSSGRIRRINQVPGKLFNLTTQIKCTRSEFALFLEWYRCRLANGSPFFTAGWLTNTVLGDYKAQFAENWSAQLGKNYKWTLSLKLSLIKRV